MAVSLATTAVVTQTIAPEDKPVNTFLVSFPVEVEPS
jgi:hypothetical protein